MVEQIKDRKLFHLTVTKPYKQALVPDQVVRIGDAYNPFMKDRESTPSLTTAGQEASKRLLGCDRYATE